MWTSRFVRGLEYDAVPRTKGLIELFISVVANTFDTTRGAESRYANCMGYVVMTRQGL